MFELVRWTCRGREGGGNVTTDRPTSSCSIHGRTRTTAAQFACMTSNWSPVYSLNADAVAGWRHNLHSMGVSQINGSSVSLSNCHCGLRRNWLWRYAEAAAAVVIHSREAHSLGTLLMAIQVSKFWTRTVSGGNEIPEITSSPVCHKDEGARECRSNHFEVFNAFSLSPLYTKFNHHRMKSPCFVRLISLSAAEAGGTAGVKPSPPQWMKATDVKQWPQGGKEKNVLPIHPISRPTAPRTGIQKPTVHHQPPGANWTGHPVYLLPALSFIILRQSTTSLRVITCCLCFRQWEI